MKFETVRIHFLSDVFGLLSSRNFATMATRRDDFSYLFGLFFRNKQTNQCQANLELSEKKSFRMKMMSSSLNLSGGKS